MVARKRPAKAGKTPAGRGPARKQGLPRHVRLFLGLLLLLLALVLTLASVAPVRRWLGHDAALTPVAPVVSVVPTESYPQPPRQQTPPREELQVEIESFLWRAGIARGKTSPLPPGGTPGWQVRGSFPAEALRLELRRVLQQLDPQLALAEDVAASSLTVQWRGAPHFRLRFRPERAPVVAQPAVARMTIIMDDLGRDLATAQMLARIDLLVTFAILPNAPAATEVAEFAHRHGREVLLHLPMEPENYPAADPGPEALWLETPEVEVRTLLAGYFSRVPHAVGGNNHMGSRFTANREAMGRVLAVLRERGVFFVDSVTSAESVAFAEAGRYGVPALRRDVFLDNEAQVEAIRAQLRKLADLAAHRGTAVGICHPHAATLEALRREAPELKRRRIEVVPASQLLAG